MTKSYEEYTNEDWAEFNEWSEYGEEMVKLRYGNALVPYWFRPDQHLPGIQDTTMLWLIAAARIHCRDFQVRRAKNSQIASLFGEIV